MIVPVLRHVADRLQHPTTGVNALLPLVPRTETDPVPPAVRILTEADAPLLALGPIDADLLEDGPVLLVTHIGASTIPISGGAVPQASVQVAVRYASPQADADRFARDAWQTLWAAARALVAPSTTAGLAAQVSTREHVGIGAPAAVSFAAPSFDHATEDFSPALVVAFPIRSPWVLGA